MELAIDDSKTDGFFPPFIELAGGAWTQGWRYGSALRQHIQTFVRDGRAKLDQVSARVWTPALLEAEIASYGRAIARQLPLETERIAGLAAGAAISCQDALLLQLRRELSGFSRMETAGDCTSFACGRGVGSVLAQTIDLNGHMAPQLNVIAGQRAGSGQHGVLMVSFTGLLGYLGINEHGLAIGLNLVVGGEWKPGIPGYMAIRHLLQTASTVAEARDRLEQLELAGSRALVLLDPGHRCTVEYLDGRLHFFDVAVHANHFAHPEFVHMDALNPLAAAFSRQREMACRDRLGRLDGEPTAMDCLRILCEAPVWVDGNDDVRKEHSVAAVVMEPGHRRLSLRCAGGAGVHEFQISPSGGACRFRRTFRR